MPARPHLLDRQVFVAAQLDGGGLRPAGVVPQHLDVNQVHLQVEGRKQSGRHVLPSSGTTSGGCAKAGRLQQALPRVHSLPRVHKHRLRQQKAVHHHLPLPLTSSSFCVRGSRRPSLILALLSSTSLPTIASSSLFDLDSPIARISCSRRGAAAVSSCGGQWCSAQANVHCTSMKGVHCCSWLQPCHQHGSGTCLVKHAADGQGALGDGRHLVGQLHGCSLLHTQAPWCSLAGLQTIGQAGQAACGGTGQAGGRGPAAARDVRGLARGRRLQPGLRQPLSARVLRRPASAHRCRPRPGTESAAHRL